MTAHRRRTDELFYGIKQIPDILLNGDIKFACIVLGFSMIMWATLGQFKQSDIVWFAKDFAFEWPAWLWTLMYYFAGFMFIHCAVRDFPPMRCLLFGTFCVSLWTLVAVTRPSASFSSGWTLNVIVIFMGAVLAQRSGRHRAP